MRIVKYATKVLAVAGTAMQQRWLKPKHYTDEQHESLVRAMAMKAELDKLTSDPNKLVQESKNEVARIMRVFLREHQITSHRLLNDIRAWSLKRTGGDSNSRHANDSGNFIKAITKEKISFERLITMMDILRPLSWSITIGVRWDARPETKIKFNYVEDPERYRALTGQEPEKYLTPIHDDHEDVGNNNVQ